MIIVRLAGGLGNQMFQYAAGLRLAMHHGTTLKLDLAVLLDRVSVVAFVPREYDLGIFASNTPIATRSEVGRFPRALHVGKRSFQDRVIGKLAGNRYHQEAKGTFDAPVLSLGRRTYLDGFFQDQRYFMDIEPEIRKRFRLAPDESSLPAATKKLADEIRRDGGICLNIRRGDYVKNPAANLYHGVCSLEYYRDAIAALRARGAQERVFVFSDDIPWCQENFRPADGFTIVDHAHKGDRFSNYLWLMTLCSHFAIPNSSFAWWAAWLNEKPAKLVARPAQWNRAVEVMHQDPCPSAWIKIPVTFS